MLKSYIYIVRTINSLRSRVKLWKKSNIEIWKIEVFGNAMLNPVHNSRAQKGWKKFKCKAVHSYLPLLLAV